MPADADGRVLFEAFTDDAVSTRDLRETADVALTREIEIAASVDVEQRLRDLATALRTSDQVALTTKQKNALEKYAGLEREFARVQAELRNASLGRNPGELEMTPLINARQW